MADKTDDQKPGFIKRLVEKYKKLLAPEVAEPKPAVTAVAEAAPPRPLVWLLQFMQICIPEVISKRADSYEEARQFLARSDEENLKLCGEKKQLIDHSFDQIAYYSFWGTIGMLLLGGISVMSGGPIMIFVLLAGLSGSTSFSFDRLARQVHLKEIEFKRQSMAEECDDRLNEYAYLLTGAVEYINAQIEIWNMRAAYLVANLTEATEKDRQRCAELHAIQQDFLESISRLTHFYELRQKEKNLKARGIQLDRLHSKLDEHLADLKPIVPKIATDPLMLEAIKEMEEVLGTNTAAEPAEAEDVTKEEKEKLDSD